MKIGRILEEALIGEGQQPRWGVSKIGGIYLEEGVHYVIYGSRLKIRIALLLEELVTHIESISAFL